MVVAFRVDDDGRCSVSSSPSGQAPVVLEGGVSAESAVGLLLCAMTPTRGGTDAEQLHTALDTLEMVRARLLVAAEVSGLRGDDAVAQAGESRERMAQAINYARQLGWSPVERPPRLDTPGRQLRARAALAMSFLDDIIAAAKR